MDKTIMKFGDNETKKQKLHQHKRPIFFFYINIYTLNKKNTIQSPRIHISYICCDIPGKKKIYI